MPRETQGPPDGVRTCNSQLGKQKEARGTSRRALGFEAAGAAKKRVGLARRRLPEAEAGRGAAGAHVFDETAHTALEKVLAKRKEKKNRKEAVSQAVHVAYCTLIFDIFPAMSGNMS